MTDLDQSQRRVGLKKHLGPGSNLKPPGLSPTELERRREGKSGGRVGESPTVSLRCCWTSRQGCQEGSRPEGQRNREQRMTFVGNRCSHGISTGHEFLLAAPQRPPLLSI